MDLHLAIKAIKSGDKETVRNILINILEADERNEQAWLWLTQTTSDKAEQIEILEEVLKINPDNQHAKKGLEQLRPKTESPKPKLKKLTPKASPIEAAPARSMVTAPPATPEKTDGQLIQEAIARYTRQGYQVISQTESSVQLRRPKQWSSGLLVLGCITLIIGLGLIILIIAAIDYAMKNEKVIYLTAAELRAKSGHSAPASLSAGWGLAIAALVIGFIMLLGLCSTIARQSRENRSSSSDLATVDPSPDTPTATQPEQENEQPPTPDLSGLPGLQAADITVSLEERGFECESAYRGENYYRWTCLSETPLYLFDATIYGDTLTTVDYVSATALIFGDEDVHDVGRSYLGFMATIPFDGGQPGEARAWVEANYRSADVYESEFGSVPYSLTGLETARILTMGKFRW